MVLVTCAVLLLYFQSIFCTASAHVFDDFDKLSELLEQETALRERAETMATEVWKAC